nr:MAG TPA: hypothetical protein [Caudoviricetes sp.]
MQVSHERAAPAPPPQLISMPVVGVPGIVPPARA